MNKLQKDKYRKKKIKMMNCMMKLNNFRKILNKIIMQLLTMNMIKILKTNLNVYILFKVLKIKKNNKRRKIIFILYNQIKIKCQIYLKFLKNLINIHKI